MKIVREEESQVTSLSVMNCLDTREKLLGNKLSIIRARTIRQEDSVDLSLLLRSDRGSSEIVLRLVPKGPSRRLVVESLLPALVGGAVQPPGALDQVPTEMMKLTALKCRAENCERISRDLTQLGLKGFARIKYEEGEYVVSLDSFEAWSGRVKQQFENEKAKLEGNGSPTIRR